MGPIYLDHNATSPLTPQARAAMEAAMGQDLGHPQSLHAAGRRAAKVVNAAREAVAALLGAVPHQVVLTSGGTEANVMALYDMVCRHDPEPVIIVSPAEHPSVLTTLHRYEALGRCSLRFVDHLPSGQVDLKHLDTLLPGAAGLCLMAANNETGILTTLEPIADRVAEHQLTWHCDTVQLVGRGPVTVSEGPLAHATTVTVAGHKLGGPTGTGALVAVRPLVESLLPGDGSLRAGTPPVVSLAGLTAALHGVDTTSENQERVAHTRDAFVRLLHAAGLSYIEHGRHERRLPNTACLSFRGPRGEWIDGEDVVEELALRGIASTTGAACVSGTGRPSHVLTAMGLKPEVASASVRFSLSMRAPEFDAETVCRALLEIIGCPEQR